MTKQHFQIIADVLNDSRDIDDKQREQLAEDFVEILRCTNPAFSSSIFLKACGVFE